MEATARKFDSRVGPEILPVFPEGSTIPKVIYQVYTNPELTPVLEDNIRSIKALNPGWDHKLFGEAEIEDFLRTAYGDAVLHYYYRINPEYLVARIDVFKYLLMYKQGGVYLDIKSSTEKPLDEVLRADDVFLLSRWPVGGSQYPGWGKHRKLRRIGGREFQQWHIIAAPGHPFLRAVVATIFDNIDHYNPVLHNTGKDGVVRLTGPIAYTLAIAPLLQKCRYRRATSHEDLGLSYSVFEKRGGSHRTMFKVYYSKLKEPITTLPANKRLLWRLLGPLQQHVTQPAVDAVRKIVRRMRDAGRRVASRR
ncbi:MAG TPA: glycosyltransferase [Steroidobacteraceae bacterium]